MPGDITQPSSVLDLESIDAALALSARDGTLRAATPKARTLLRRLTDSTVRVSAALPRTLWAALEEVELGRAVELRPVAGKLVIGCTRYRCQDGYLLIMKEVSLQRAATSGRLHSQRLEAIGRLVASIAHELRNSVASIVYSADLLSIEGVSEATRSEMVHEILSASRRLQGTVAGVLDYAKLGPSVSVPVSLREVLTRSQGFLRSLYRDGSHQLSVAIAPEAEWVRGNSLIVEQIFMNLLLNAAQAARERPARVEVRSDLAPAPSLRTLDAAASAFVRVRVSDDGPGIPPELRESIFEPFFTTRHDGTGLGLNNARDAAEALGGELVLDQVPVGAQFAVYLPLAERPPGTESRL